VSFLASPQDATNRRPLNRPRRGHMMLNQLFQTEWQPLSQYQWTRVKRLLLVMLGLWMTYFLLVNAFVHSLNKIAIPVLGIPLGYYLAVQGAAIVFAIALFRFAKDRA
jgi:putative solute:sodium symporter small subunit